MAHSENPHVSYILCVYNGERTLVETVRSLLSQKNVNLEIIAVNDGSTDSSLEILKKFALKHKEIKIINQENMGLSIARNIGIKHATGDYIASASQDDIYLPEKTIDQINFLIANDLDFCFTQVRLIDENGKFIKSIVENNYNALYLPFPLVILQVLIFMNSCSPTFLCRKKCYQKFKWHPGLLIFADKYLWLKMFCIFKGGKLPAISLFRRVNLTRRFKIPVSFIYLEHRAAMFQAILSFVLPLNFIPGMNIFLKVSKILDRLDRNNQGVSAYAQLGKIYKSLGYKYPAAKLIKIGENLIADKISHKI